MTAPDDLPAAEDQTASDDSLTARRFIPATPAEIFAVLADPLGHVDIDASGMLQDAEGDTGDERGGPVRRAHGSRGAG